jgi:hypothetical protein
VQVAACVAERAGHGEFEGCVADVAVGGGERGGDEFEVIADGGVKVL